MAIPLRHSNPLHVIAGARTFFVTSSISGKRNLLQSDRSAGLFIRVLYDYRTQRKFRLHEFVVTSSERCNSSRVASRSGPDGSLDSAPPSGKKASRRCVSPMPTRFGNQANISGTIPLRGTLQPQRSNTPTPQRIRDLNWIRRHRG